MLTRRRFVQTVGIGAGAAWVSSRGRENAVWDLFEPRLQAVEPGMICLSSNENPVGPGQKVLDAVKNLGFGPTGATPGRYSGASGPLVDAIAKKFNIKPENIALSRLME